LKAHGGTIEARSAGLGYGSEFIVRLRLSPLDPVTPPRAENPTSRPTRSGILVADDDRDAPRCYDYPQTRERLNRAW
jgi:hypothetical protein